MSRKRPVVADVMSRDVHTLGRNDALSIADGLMQQARIRHLPVLDEDGVLCGIVSQRDLFRGAGVPTVPVVVGVWWGAFLVSGFVDRLSLALAPSDDLVGLDYIDASITSSGLDIASSALDLVAALLAIVVVRRATRAVRQDPPALEMPATTVP